MKFIKHFFVQIAAITDYLLEGNSDVHYGCEVDLDSIVDFPSSAKTPVGISPEQASHFVQQISSRLRQLYLHLSEGAPRWARRTARGR